MNVLTMNVDSQDKRRKKSEMSATKASGLDGLQILRSLEIEEGEMHIRGDRLLFNAYVLFLSEITSRSTSRHWLSAKTS